LGPPRPQRFNVRRRFASTAWHCARACYFADAAGTAARFLAKADGPRVRAVGFVGWDTHIRRVRAPVARHLLGALDGALAAIRHMADSWRETGGRVHHEFGRTARINGTDGTDHGTGTVAFSPAAHSGRRMVADCGTEARPTL